MNLDQIKELVAYLETSKVRKFLFKKGDFELQLEKEEVCAPQRPVRTVSAETPNETAFYPEPSSKVEKGRADAPGNYVKSPMVGSYYSSPAPDQPAFVKVGDKVNENTVVCIIEAMKVMNEVKAGVAGTVAEVLADNGQPVEFGTRLLRIT
jgi:acetyl-CoA carboxylase biotin carboxyl carrier protein